MSERAKLALGLFLFMAITVLISVAAAMGVVNQKLFGDYYMDDSIPREQIEISTVDFFDVREDGEKEPVTGYILTDKNTNTRYLITDMFDPIEMSEEAPQDE